MAIQRPGHTSGQAPQARDLVLLVLLALVRVLLQAFTNDSYGFFRDELVTLDDARNLEWGYVAYPPVTPFLGRVALELFGPSLNGIRLFAVLVQAGVMLLVGWMACWMGARRFGMVLAALVVATTPASLVGATLLQYAVFDYFAWVLISFCVVGLLRSEDQRWWVGIGAAIGLGVMTKYAVAFFVAGIAVGLVLTPSRRCLRGIWPWVGGLVSVALALPNLIWQARHGFLSLAFLQSIHARDVTVGRADGFLRDQLRIQGNPMALLLVAGGLWFLFTPPGRRYRTLAWMYVTPLVLFLAMKGRGYYLTPAYPMLIAAGAVWLERLIEARSEVAARRLRLASWGTLAAGTSAVLWLTLPTAPVHSQRWRLLSTVNQNLKEEIGWPELVDTVASIHARLPAEEKPRAGILTGDGAEAGAINLLGRGRGLPRAISGFNSHWLRGYGEPPPETIISVGLRPDLLARYFERCELAGRITNRYGIANEETTDAPEVFLCRGLLLPWPDLWARLQEFG